MAVSIVPSFNKTPIGPSTPPVPYPVFQTLELSVGTVSTVNFNRDPAYVFGQTLQPTCVGDAPGVALGIKSGTVSGPVLPVKGSSTVNVGGRPIIRPGDPCLLNGGNCLGIYVTQPSPVGSIVGGEPSTKLASIGPETASEEKHPWNERYKTGFLTGATKSWEELKGSAATVWEATGLSSASDAEAQAARGRIWAGAKALGSLASDVAIATSPMMATTPQAAEARHDLAHVGQGIAHGIAKKYEDSYADGGFAEAAGTGTWDVANVIIQVLVAKGAGAVLDAAGGVVGVGSKAIEGATAVSEESNAAERIAQDVTSDATTEAEKGTSIDGFRVLGEQSADSEAPAAAAADATETPAWSSTRTKSAAENLQSHFEKHASEFPDFETAKDFGKAARDFVTDPPEGTLLKTRPNGDTLLYDPATNTFAVRAENGAPRTMFRPTDGIDYWNKQ